MRNWSTDTIKMDFKKDPKAEKWRVEQLLNFGMDEGDVISVKYLRENLNKLNIKDDMRDYLKFIVSDGSKGKR